MILRSLAVGGACLVVLLAVIGYTPVPEEMEDRHRAMFLLGLFKLLLYTPFQISNWLGYGSFMDNLETIQKFTKSDYSKPVPSAAWGVLDVSRSTIDGVKVIIYKPKDIAKGELLPAIVYLHGGGWVFLSADVYDPLSHKLANCTRAVLVAVDYRLAPDHPFPVPVEDCLKVTKHVLSRGKEMNIDVNRVGILGDASGGNMAAAIAHSLTKEKSSSLPPLKFQAMLWPPMQALNLRLPSYIEIGNLILHPDSHQQAGFWAAYLGLDRTQLDEAADIMLQNAHVSPELLRKSKYSKYVDPQNLPEKFRRPRREVMGTEPPPDPKVKTDDKLFKQIQSKLTNPMMSPLMAPDLGGVPPAFVLVSEFEIVRDDGLLYAHRLREAGVRTEVVVTKGFHLDINPIFPPPLSSVTGQKTFDAVCSFMRKEA